MSFLTFLKKSTEIRADELSFQIYQSAEFEFLVVSLITEGQPTSQLENRKGSKGEPLGFYSLFTEIETGGRKKEGEPYDLKESGVYYDSHELDSRLGGFKIVANSTKQGEDFLVELNIPEEEAQNLTDENLEIIIQEHKELMQEAFRDIIDSFKTI